MQRINPRTQKPYQHNDLFRGDPASSHLNACVGYNGGPYDDRTYADGYMRSGFALIGAAERNEQPVDILVYPIAYCFRHGIELYLKHFCKTLPRLWSETAIPAATHRLLDNWATAQGYLRRDPSFDPDNAAISQVDKIIRDFVQIDPSGEIFRFPVSRKGGYHLENVSLINVLVLKSAMTELGDLLSFWDYKAEEIREYQLEHRG